MTATATPSSMSVPPAPAPAPVPAPVRARRPLEIPPPNVRPEPPVREATKAVADARAGKVAEAQDVIDDNGLTIEVGRLRERLARSPVTDVQRLLLSTPGVLESLFLDAVDDQLPQPAPPPPSVDEFGEKIGTADTLAQSLADRLGDVLAGAMYHSIGEVLTNPRVLDHLSKAMSDALRDAGAGDGYGPYEAAGEKAADAEAPGEGAGEPVEAQPAPESTSEPTPEPSAARGGRKSRSTS